MAYSDYTWPAVITDLGLTEVSADLFAAAAAVTPSQTLTSVLRISRPVASLGNVSEKARSELLVTPILLELLGRADGRLSLFSGIDFPADPDAGLTGFCDFLLGRGPQIPRPVAPLLTVIEAKRDNLENGYGQCIAGMVGIQRFNHRAGRPDAPAFGIITTGMLWKILRLVGTTLTYDIPEYTIDPIDQLLGVLTAVTDAALAGHP